MVEGEIQAPHGERSTSWQRVYTERSTLLVTLSAAL